MQIKWSTSISATWTTGSAVQILVVQAIGDWHWQCVSIFRNVFRCSVVSYYYSFIPPVEHRTATTPYQGTWEGSQHSSSQRKNWFTNVKSWTSCTRPAHHCPKQGSMGCPVTCCSSPQQQVLVKGQLTRLLFRPHNLDFFLYKLCLHYA